jgi:5'-nucleotidase
MNILLTNDDGYNSEGIVLLEKLLAKYGNVYVCAPYKHMSAKSCSITIYEAIHLMVNEGQKISIDGTPADCVAFGLEFFKVHFDLVISGCNNGYNISYDTMYSGTIGACLQSIVHGTPAIAISCPSNFDIVDKYFDKVMKFVIDHKLISNKYLLNINFPEGDVINDIQIGKLYVRHDYGYFIKDEENYHTCRNMESNFIKTDTDCYQVNHGIVSIVPLSNSYFKESQFQYLLKKVHKHEK